MHHAARARCASYCVVCCRHTKAANYFQSLSTFILSVELKDPENGVCGISTAQAIGNWGGVGTFQDIINSPSVQTLLYSIFPVIVKDKNIRFAGMADSDRINVRSY